MSDLVVASKKRDAIRHDLKTVEGGWIEIRQLSYDEMLERRDGASRIIMETGGARRNAASQNMAIQLANKWSNHFTFPRCIVDHNLADDQGVRYDFKKPNQVFQSLDPKVGAEIESLIDALNQEEEDAEDFTEQPDSSSPDGQNSPIESTESI